MLQENEKITLCITTYNRPEQTKQAYQNIIDDDRISEVIIVDDFSTPYNKINLEKNNHHPKLFIEYNNRNLGVYKNKFKSVELAKTEWVIVLDSDNLIDKSYIDKIYSIDLSKSVAYLPSFAKPHFDYRNLVGVYNHLNIKELVKHRYAFTLLNTMNFFVNRKAYMDAYDDNIEPITADSIYINYKLLKNGYNIEVVPDLEYFHLVHNQSHYKLHQHKGNSILARIHQNLKLMR